MPGALARAEAILSGAPLPDEEKESEERERPQGVLARADAVLAPPPEPTAEKVAARERVAAMKAAGDEQWARIQEQQGDLNPLAEAMRKTGGELGERLVLGVGQVASGAQGALQAGASGVEQYGQRLQRQGEERAEALGGPSLLSPVGEKVEEAGFELGRMVDRSRQPSPRQTAVEVTPHISDEDFWRGLKEDPLRTLSLQGVTQIPQLVATFGAAGAAGMAGGAGVGFLQEAGHAHNRAIEEGATQEQAVQAAGMTGLANMFLEYLPAGQALKRLAGPAKNEAVGLVKDIIQQAASEGITESAQELNGILMASLTYAEDHEWGWEDLKQAGAAGILGAVVGGPIGAVTSVASRPQDGTLPPTDESVTEQEAQDEVRQPQLSDWQDVQDQPRQDAQSDEGRGVQAREQPDREPQRGEGVDQEEVLEPAVPSPAAEAEPSTPQSTPPPVETRPRPGEGEVVESTADPEFEQWVTDRAREVQGMEGVGEMPALRDAVSAYSRDGSEGAWSALRRAGIEDPQARSLLSTIEDVVPGPSEAASVDVAQDPAAVISTAITETAAAWKSHPSKILDDSDPIEVIARRRVADAYPDDPTAKAINPDDDTVARAREELEARVRARTQEQDALEASGRLIDPTTGDLMGGDSRVIEVKSRQPEQRESLTGGRKVLSEEAEPDVELPGRAAGDAEKINAALTDLREGLATGTVNKAEAVRRLEQLERARMRLSGETDDLARKSVEINPPSYADPEEVLGETVSRQTPQEGTQEPEADQAPAPQEQAQEGATQPQEQPSQEARPVDIAEISPQQIDLEPERFQFKLDRDAAGSTGSLAGVSEWDPNLAGVVSAWRDPSDNRLKVVNGHNRVAKARQLQVPNIRIMEIDAESAKEARAVGAMQNIAEGHGTPVDAAKFFRDSGMIEEEAVRKLPLSQATVDQGLGLAGLSDFLFGQVTQGELAPQRGAIIGRHLRGKDDLQNQLYKEISKREKRQRVTNDMVEDIARRMELSGTVSEESAQVGLFGDTGATERSLAFEEADIAADIRKRLRRQKSAFSNAARNAPMLSEAGNVIDQEMSRGISEEAAVNLAVFDKLRNTTEIGGIISEAARDLAAGKESADAIKAQAFERIREAVGAALGRRTQEGTSGVSEVEEGGSGADAAEGGVEGQVEAGQGTLFDEGRERSTKRQRSEFSGAVSDAVGVVSDLIGAPGADSSLLAGTSQDVGRKIETFLGDLDTWRKKWFKQSGNLPVSAWKLKLNKDHNLAAHERGVAIRLRQLNRAIKNYDGPLTEKQLVRYLGDAIRGNVLPGGASETNTLDAVQIQRIAEKRGVDPELVRARAEKAGTKGATLALAPEFAPLIAKVRADLDALTRSLRREGLLEDGVARQLERMHGLYTHRSYEAFRGESKKYLRKMEQNPLWNRAAELVAKENPSWSQDEVNGYLRELVDRDRDSVLPGNVPEGALNRSTLFNRTEVRDLERALIGQRRDVRSQLVDTIIGQASLLEHHRFLKALREDGLDRYLFKRATGEFYRPIAEEVSPVPVLDEKGEPSLVYRTAAARKMGPLTASGKPGGQPLYTSPEILSELEDAMPSVQNMGWALRTYMAANFATKTGLTVLAPGTAARNYLSGMLPAIANGYNPFSREGQSLVWRDIANSTSEDLRDRYMRYVQLGVMDQSADYGDLRRIGEFADLMQVETNPDAKMTTAAKRALRKAGEIYQHGDNFWKILAFEKERQRLSEAYPDASDAKLDRDAAEIVQRVMQNYARLPRFARGLSTNPIVAPFFSFTWAMFTNVVETAKQAGTEIRSENAAVKKNGYRRLGGLIFALSIPELATLAFRWMANADDEDDKALREFVYPWDRGSTLGIVYNGPGQYTYFNWGFMDYFSKAKEPIRYVLQIAGGRTVEETATDVLADYGPEVLLGSVIEAWMGQTVDGYRIWERRAPLADKLANSMDHIRRTSQPGAFRNVENISEALSESGNRKLWIELTAALGPRFTEVDVAKKLDGYGSRFSSSLSSATRLYSQYANRRQADTDDMLKGYKQANEERLRVVVDLRKKIEAAIVSGMSQDEVESILMDSGLPGKYIDMAWGGQFEPVSYEKGSAWEDIEPQLQELADEATEAAARVLQENMEAPSSGSEGSKGDEEDDGD